MVRTRLVAILAVATILPSGAHAQQADTIDVSPATRVALQTARILATGVNGLRAISAFGVSSGVGEALSARVVGLVANVRGLPPRGIEDPTCQPRGGMTIIGCIPGEAARQRAAGAWRIDPLMVVWVSHGEILTPPWGGTMSTIRFRTPGRP